MGQDPVRVVDCPDLHLDWSRSWVVKCSAVV